MKREIGLNIAIGAAVLVIAGALLFMFLVPKPTLSGIAERERTSERTILKEAGEAKTDLAASDAKLTQWTWKGDPQEVGPAALNALSLTAKQNRVKLSGFRPQRSAMVEGLELMPFAVTAEGAYPDVLRFVQGIERSESKLIVDRLQIASAEANSNLATAVVGVTAYRMEAKKND
jgi:hypothetical protein